MSSSIDNRQRLIDLLTNYMSIDNREAIVRSAFYDTKLLQRISFDGAPYNFTERLVATALSYEKLETTGEFAVIALIDETLRYIGAGSAYTEFQALKVRLQEDLSGQGTPQPVHPKTDDKTTVSPETVSSSDYAMVADPRIIEQLKSPARKIDKDKKVKQPEKQDQSNNKEPGCSGRFLKWVSENPVVAAALVGVLTAMVAGCFAIGVALIESGFLPLPSTETPTPAITETIETEEPTDMPIIMVTDEPDTPTDTPQPITHTPIIATTVIPGGDTEITVFPDENSLTLYITGDALADVSGLAFEFMDNNRERVKSIMSYDAFASIADRLPTPFCLRLRNDTTSPLEQECDTDRTVTQQLANSDIFWYDDVRAQLRTLIITHDGETIGICGAGQSRCEVTLP